MVFQKSNPFPKSIFDNVAYGLHVNGWAGAAKWATWSNAACVERPCGMKSKTSFISPLMDFPADNNNGCVSPVRWPSCPEVLLLDEPCSALDPIATAKIEELLFQLKSQCTIVIVTHNMQQAARVADYTAFFLMGKLIEFNETKTIYTTPRNKETEDYITGRFG